MPEENGNMVDPKSSDPARWPVFGIKDFPAIGIHIVTMESKNASDFIRKYKLEPGSQFWLSDDDTEVLSTLGKHNGVFQAQMHWGRRRDCVVKE
jgi:hypothetical protein